jgi:hypothetical protein
MGNFLEEEKYTIEIKVCKLEAFVLLLALNQLIENKNSAPNIKAAFRLQDKIMPQWHEIEKEDAKDAPTSD